MPETQSTRRLQWLLWALLAWVGRHLRAAGLAAGAPSRRPAAAGASSSNRRLSEDSSPARLHPGPHRPAAGENPAGRIGVRQSAEDSGRGVAADLLAAHSGPGSRAQLYEKHRRRISCATSGFMWVKRKVAAEEAERVRSLKLDYVEFRPEMRRFYPHGRTGLARGGIDRASSIRTMRSSGATAGSR